MNIAPSPPPLPPLLLLLLLLLPPPPDWAWGIMEQFITLPYFGLRLQRPGYELFILEPVRESMEQVNQIAFCKGLEQPPKMLFIPDTSGLRM